MIPCKKNAIILKHKMSLGWIRIKTKNNGQFGIINGTTGNSNIQKKSWLSDF